MHNGRRGSVVSAGRIWLLAYLQNEYCCEKRRKQNAGAED